MSLSKICLASAVSSVALGACSITGMTQVGTGGCYMMKAMKDGSSDCATGAQAVAPTSKTKLQDLALFVGTTAKESGMSRASVVDPALASANTVEHGPAKESGTKVDLVADITALGAVTYRTKAATGDVNYVCKATADNALSSQTTATCTAGALATDADETALVTLSNNAAVTYILGQKVTTTYKHANGKEYSTAEKTNAKITNTDKSGMCISIQSTPATTDKFVLATLACSDTKTYGSYCEKKTADTSNVASMGLSAAALLVLFGMRQ